MDKHPYLQGILNRDASFGAGNMHILDHKESVIGGKYFHSSSEKYLFVVLMNETHTLYAEAHAAVEITNVFPFCGKNFANSM